MADVTEAFLRGHQYGQAEQAHEQQLAENKLRTQVLKHEITRMGIEDQIRARDLARQNFEMQSGQPAADIPSDEVTTQQPNLPAGNLAGMVSGLIRGQQPTGMGATPTAAAPADVSQPSPAFTPAPAAQSATPGTNPIRSMVAKMMQIPGVEGLGVPGVSVRPQSAETLTARAIATKRAEQPPHVLGPQDVLADTAGNILAKNENEKPAAGEFGEFMKSYAESLGAKAFKDLTPAQKLAVNAKYAEARADPLVRAQLIEGRDSAIAYRKFMERDAVERDKDRDAQRAQSADLREHAGYVANLWKQHADAMKKHTEDLKSWMDPITHPENLDPSTRTAQPVPPAPPEIPSLEEWQAMRDAKKAEKAAPAAAAGATTPPVGKEGEVRPIPGKAGQEMTYKKNKAGKLVWIRTR